MLATHLHEERPWGAFDTLVMNTPCTVKMLWVSAGERFSLQRHQKRTEYWKVIEGDGILRLGENERSVAIGDEVEIPQGMLHRLTGGDKGIRVLEISTGEFDENDIERLEDDYGRTGP
ncbi:MAG: phosphomannose isomerase type II C-terminal cupin domain [Patescibacteria group bacterium]